MRLPVDHLLGQRMKAPLMKSVNGIGILNLIREHGPVSRADLAKLSRLSKPTVSSITDHLIRRGLVLEQGPGKSGERGGKKPTLIQFNAQCGLLVAAEIGADFVRVALTDLEGVILDRQCVPAEVAGGAPHVLDQLESGIRQVLSRGRSRRPRLVAISVAASGRVDVGRGLVLEAGNVFNWHEVAVRDRFEPVFDVPVFVDNNVNMAALGELHHGAARSEKNFALVWLDTGIGCGVVLSGKLYHGSHWAAGEIAHGAVGLDSLARDWGPRGYLENFVGEDIVAQRIRDAARDSAMLADLCATREPVVAAAEAAAAGDAVAAAVLEPVVSHLALGAAIVAAAYDPALIVLQGRTFEILFERIREATERLIPWGVKICLSALGSEAVLLGAVVAARSQAYERIVRELHA